VKKIYKRNRKR